MGGGLSYVRSIRWSSSQQAMRCQSDSEGASAAVGATLDLLFRRRAGQLTATLTRILGIDQLDLVEDVVQEAFVQALRRWPSTGVPDNPSAWVLGVAKNRALDLLRRQGRWAEKREELERAILPVSATDQGEQAFFADGVEDDELRMIFVMCHPVLARDAQIALTLKTVGGFGVNEIARAFLTSKPTIAQRLVRAKRTLRENKIPLKMPTVLALPAHLNAVLEVLYLMFNEGHSAAAGEELVRGELCGEAIRMVQLLSAHPTVGEPRVDALAALFLFQAARLPARMDLGQLIPLDRQDRTRWDRRLIQRALAYHHRSARGVAVSSYHLQAEIASYHTLAPSYGDTDWHRILVCFDDLLAIDPSPVVALNRILPLAEVEGVEVGMKALQRLKKDEALGSYYPLFAIEAELFARLERFQDAHEAVSIAISLVQSLPVRRHLQSRALEHMKRFSQRSLGGTLRFGP